ncbi:MAG: glycoside hydrolase family 2 protein [Thermoproteota archaeon]
MVVKGTLRMTVLSPENWVLGRKAEHMASNVKLPDKNIINLNDDWTFITDPEGTLTYEVISSLSNAREARAGLPWEAQFPDLVDYDGVTWYRRSFKIPREFLGKTIILRFDAVDYETCIWLNGKKIGSHEGGYTPFEFEVSDIVRFGEPNELILRVFDPKDCSEIPNGKQSYYCNIGGLWQGVKILIRERVYVHSIFVVPDVDRSKIMVRIIIRHPEGIPDKGLELTLRVVPDREEAVVETTRGKFVYDVEIPLRESRLWSPECPFLYGLEVCLSGEGINDICFVDFGMRKIDARDNMVLLNDEPVYLMGALDQGFYPDVIYGTPSDGMLRDQFLKVKELGLNFLRTHIKIPCPNYLEWADRLGIMLWIDFPSFYKFTERATMRMKKELEEWIWRDFNHPSIFCWCLINEEWGIPLIESAEARIWLKEIWHFTKSLDPTRLVVDNSPANAGHIISDLDDQHVYMAIPDHAREFENWMTDFSKYPPSMFRFPESERRGFEPLLVSEFGNWGLPDVEEILRYYNQKDPYWFNQASYGGPIRSGIDNFFDWKLDEVYGSLKGLAEATQRHQLDSLKFEIETMRLHPEVVGYVITQFTDLNSESNGLIDMCRGTKFLHRFMHFFQAQDVIVIRPARWCYLEGEEIKTRIYVSKFSAFKPKALEWWLENVPSGGKLNAMKASRISCTEVGEINFKAPEVDGPKKLTMWTRLLNEEGREICRNYQEIWVLPTWSIKNHLKVCLFGEGKDIVEKLKEIGLSIVKPNETRIALSIGLNEDAIDFVKRGGRVLLLLDGAEGGSSLPGGLRLVERKEKGRWGDWCTSFLWLKKDVAKRLPYEGHLGMPFIECIPTMVLESLNPNDIRKALGGIFLGWMREPAATIFPIEIEAGLLILCTFSLSKNIGNDPVATALFCSLIDVLKNGSSSNT